MDGNMQKDATRGWLDRAKSIARRGIARLRRPDLYRMSTPNRLGSVVLARNNMPMEERITLFALVRAARPARALEIGVQYGGSSLIITSAMEDNGLGRLVGIDPQPLIESMSVLHGRYSLVRGTSPEAIPQAVEILGGPLDFVLMDGLNTHRASGKDLDGLLPHMAEGGYILLHNAYHFGLNQMVEERLAVPGTRLHDGGFLCRSARTDLDPWVALNGFRLLRIASPSWTGSREIEAAYLAQGKEAPPFRPDILNHGPWGCRNVEPCERCASEGLELIPARKPSGAGARPLANEDLHARK